MQIESIYLIDMIIKYIRKSYKKFIVVLPD